MAAAHNPYGKVDWTDEMIAKLKELRKKGHPTLTCAAAVGVSPDTCQKKMRELGLNKKLNRGRTKGIHAV